MFGPNASAIEMLWTGVGVGALVINLILFFRAVGNLRALDALGQNGGRRMSAWTAIGIQGGLTLPQVVAVAIGVAAMTLPPANPANPAPPAATVIGLGILANEAILAAVAVYALARWHILDHYFEARLRDEASTVAALGRAQHAETMTELAHNTEVTTEARDGALDAYRAANEVNEKIVETNRVAGEAAEAATESTEKLRLLVERLEVERKAREEGC